MEIIPYSIVSGLLTVIALNSVCIFLFYKIFTMLIAIIQTQFFIPQISDRNKKIGGMIVGACVGYIFVAGMITSLEEVTVYKKHHHTKLVNSVFYKSHNERHNVNVSRKIDNIPALYELYAENNVTKFNFTESELLSIMKMIREISNEEAKNILDKIKAKESIGIVYLHLIEIYSQKVDVQKKYFVSKEDIAILKTKIEEVNKMKNIITPKKTIDNIIDGAV
jgi:hypothetical protein